MSRVSRLPMGRSAPLPASSKPRTVAALLVAGLVALPLLAHSAIHYPLGSRCYDCHAVSKDKMVVGTHLLKKSQKTIDLGITGSSTPIRCLFCHEKGAVSLESRTVMRGVWEHFDARSTSRHPSDVQSTFFPDPSAFDCLDCHTGITAGVVSDGAGNANVHGVDPALGPLDVYSTLIGAPGGAGGLSTLTCQNAACHDGDGGGTGNYDAPPRHSYTVGVTIDDGTPAEPVACTDCHGSHNSYQNTALVVLRTDGTTSNAKTDPPGTAVTPNKCGECHSQDDAGIYASRGHGQGAIAGGLQCTACHSGNVPHPFSSSAPGNNPLRFALAEVTSAQSVVRREPPYDQVYSVCLTCHGQYEDGAHQGHDGVYAGCNDCHEPHGAGVSTNAKMVRAVIPKVDAAGNPVYGDGTGGAYEPNVYDGPQDFFRADGQGLCDNAECHEGQLSAGGNPIYPLADFMGAGWHSDAPQSPGDDCTACHVHADPGGSWGAKSACLTCHGQPPPPADPGYTGFPEATSGHPKHAGQGPGQYRYPCSACHAQYPTNHRDGSYQSVSFGSLNPGGAYASGACNNLYCHSSGQSPASTGNAPLWDAGPQTCHACHGGSDPATRISTGSHTAHLAWPGLTCAHCHADTVLVVGTDTTTAIADTAAHANGAKNLRAGTQWNGQDVSFAPGSGTCASISCHGGGSAAWGGSLGCADCHLAGAGVDRDNYAFADGLVAVASGSEWTGAGHGRTTAFPSGNPAAGFAGPAGDPRGCAYCHGVLGTGQNPATAHGDPGNPFRLANRSGSDEDGGWNQACLVCHGNGDSGYDPDGASSGYASRNGTKNVDANHYGVKHSDPTLGGTFCWDCHDPHGDANPYMVHSGAGNAPGRGVTDRSDGTHGVPVTSRPVTGFAPATGGYTSDDLVNAGNTGLCQTCHDPAGGADHYNRSTFTAPTAHNGADAIRCTQCHRHASDFTANCTDCHGNTAAGNWWPDGTAEHGAGYANRPGAHQKHVDAIHAANAGTLAGATVVDRKNQTCAWCHPTPGGVRPGTGEAEHNVDAVPTGTADIHGDGRAGAAASNFRNLAGAASPGGAYDPSGHVCSNIACHGGASTPSRYFVGGVGDAQAPAVNTVRVNGAAPASIQVGTPTVSLTATCTDTATGGSTVAAAEYFVGVMGTPGTGTHMAAADGLFDTPTEAVSASVSSAAWVAGTDLYVDCKDAAGNWGPAGGGVVAVTLTGQTTFTAALSSGPTETVFPGYANKTAAVVTLTFLAGPSPAQVNGVTITGTGTGSPGTNVSVVKIYRDTGSTPNSWDAGDTLLGTGAMNVSNVAVIPFSAAVASGTPWRLLVTYDIAAGAVAGNTLGAQLTAVATPPTTALATPLPLSSAAVKTVATSTAATHYPYASTGTTIASAGQTATNYAGCGTAAVSRGSFYTLLSSGAPPCNTLTTWTNTGGANQSMTAIWNTVVDPTRNVTIRGRASGNRFYVGNNTGVAGNFTVNFVDFDPVTGTATVIGTGVSATVQPPVCCDCLGNPIGGYFFGNLSLSAITGTVLAGHRLGLRITVPANDWWVSFGNTGYGYLVVDTLAIPFETTPPTLSIAPAVAPPTIQAGTPTVNLTATCSDVSTGNSNIVAAEYFVGASGTAGTGLPLFPVSGFFGVPTVAVAAAVDSSAWAADTTLYVDCKDGGGTWGPAPKGSASVTVTPKDAFTVTGNPGPTETLGPGDRDTVVQVLTFNATAAGTSVQVQGVQITGTRDLGSGQVYSDVSQVKVYNDTGTAPNQWDASDVLLGASACDTANLAHVTFTAPLLVTNPTPARLLVTYDIAGTPTAGDRIGASLTAVNNPATDDLTTALPIASGNVKTITAFYCGACHGLPPVSAQAAGSHSKHVSGREDHTDCDACHPGASAYGNGHADGKWQLSFSGNPSTFGVKIGGALTVSEGSVIYSDGSSDGTDNGTCAETGCHGPATPVWGNPGSVTCAQCHNDGSAVVPNAPTVTPASPHVDADRSGSTWATGDCRGCHAGHRGAVTVPLPPTDWGNVNLSARDMRAALGMDYPLTGGVHLGGPGTANSIATKTTEAEICWGCHETVASSVPGNPYVSEWGYNTKTTPSSFPVVRFPTANDGLVETFNFGWLYNSGYTGKVSDWTQGYWMDQYDPLVKRRVASVHTANFAAAGQSSSVADNLWANGTVKRSSPVLEDKKHIRCSYCHDVHDTAGPDGRPYLRGTWIGNPYPPELPPRPGYAFTTTPVVGGTLRPRGTSAARDKGGYFIDQNSNWPTNNGAMDTLGETAGLCTLCHGTNVDDMDFYTGATLWRSGQTNGHSNSTVGGLRARRVDLFSAFRGGATYTMQMQDSTGCTTERYWDNSRPQYFPYSAPCINVSGWYGTDYANWYGTTGQIGGASGAGSMAHKFTCSKCHTPHASGLPALLTHNCVDPAQGGFTALGYQNQAGNCHRKTSTSDGWHKLAPGQ